MKNHTKWYFNPIERSAESGAKRKVFCDEFDDKCQASDSHHAHEDEAQVLGIVFLAGLFCQPEGLNHFSYLALDYCQVKFSSFMRYIKYLLVAMSGIRRMTLYSLNAQ